MRRRAGSSRTGWQGVVQSLLPLLGGSNSHSTLNLPERDLFKPYLSFHSLRVCPGSYLV
jgi:hypothetical protein